jgi:hypothetical protein
LSEEEAEAAADLLSLIFDGIAYMLVGLHKHPNSTSLETEGVVGVMFTEHGEWGTTVKKGLIRGVNTHLRTDYFIVGDRSRNTTSGMQFSWRWVGIQYLEAPPFYFPDENDMGPAKIVSFPIMCPRLGAFFGRFRFTVGVDWTIGIANSYIKKDSVSDERVDVDGFHRTIGVSFSLDYRILSWLEAGFRFGYLHHWINAEASDDGEDKKSKLQGDSIGFHFAMRWSAIHSHGAERYNLGRLPYPKEKGKAPGKGTSKEAVAEESEVTKPDTEATRQEIEEEPVFPDSQPATPATRQGGSEKTMDEEVEDEAEYEESAESARKRLIGRWQAVSILKDGKKKSVPSGFRWFMEFEQGGIYKVTVLVGQKSKAKAGTWKITGNVVETEQGGKKQRMTYRIKADILELGTEEKGYTVWKKVSDTSP